jgi:hypothetical protein
MTKKHQIKVSSAKGRTNAGKKWRRKRNELFRQSHLKSNSAPSYNRASRRKVKQLAYKEETEKVNAAR